MVLEEEGLSPDSLQKAIRELSAHRQDYIDAMERCPQSDAIGIYVQ